MPSASTGDEIRTLLTTAVARFGAGQIRDAEAACQAILARAPDQIDALRLLGTIASRRRDFQNAVPLFARAVAANPRLAVTHRELGAALHHAGRHAEAVASYAQSLALAPDDPTTLYNFASALVALGRNVEALEIWDRQLALSPNHLGALSGRAATLFALHRPAEALAIFDHVVALKPDQPEAFCNRGAILADLGRYEEALDNYGYALTLQPNYAQALLNRGNALLAMERHEAALADYENTLAIQPDHPDALNNRGTALLALARAEEALTAYDQVLALRPNSAQVLANRGKALIALARRQDALESYDRALAIDNASAELWLARGWLLFELTAFEGAVESYDRALSIESQYEDALAARGAVLGLLGRHDEAARDFGDLVELRPDAPYAFGDWLFARLQGCDWRDLAESVDRVERGVAAGQPVIRPFKLLGLSASAVLQRQCAELYCHRFYPAPDRPVWRGERYRHDRIRIAYLSADFHGHATAHLLTELIERHDRNRFEVTAISFGRSFEDCYRARLIRAFDRFLDLRDRTDRDIAQMMRDLEIDIAVDLKGHTLDGRPGVLALRPAPVQVNYLGYPGTIGADYVDYLIADRIIVPEEHEAFYCESIVRLPDSYQPNDSRRPIADDIAGRPAFGLPEQGFVFCCFNSPYKLTPQIFAVWMQLLRQIEGSVLWLLDGGPVVRENLRHAAEAAGLARDRLVFAPRAEQAEHLARHRHADLFLDCLPYGGHTTVSDALWAGLPVITSLGSSFAGRVAASLLTAAGLPELVAEDLTAYASLALTVARDNARLASLKQRLASVRATCALFDAPRYCNHIEAAYETMWRRYQQGEMPAGFTVQPGR